MPILSLAQAVQITSYFQERTLLTKEKMHSFSPEHREICKTAFLKVKYSTKSDLEDRTKDPEKIRTFKVIDPEAKLEEATFNAFVEEIKKSVEIEEEPIVSTFVKVINAITGTIHSIFIGIANIFGRISSAELYELGNRYLLDRDKAVKTLEKFNGNHLHADENVKMGRIKIESDLVTANAAKRKEEIEKANELNEITKYLESLNIKTHREKLNEELAAHANMEDDLMDYLELEPIVVEPLMVALVHLKPIDEDRDLTKTILGDFFAKKKMIHDELAVFLNGELGKDLTKIAGPQEITDPEEKEIQGLSNAGDDNLQQKIEDLRDQYNNERQIKFESRKNDLVFARKLFAFAKQYEGPILETYKDAIEKLTAAKEELYSEEGDLAQAVNELKLHGKKLQEAKDKQDLLIAKYGLKV